MFEEVEVIEELNPDLEEFFGKKDEVKPSELFTKTLAKYKNKERKVYAYFEGPDDHLFYSQPIKEMYNSYSYEYECCHGKENVFATYKDAIHDKDYEKHRYLFFVDKDLDDILGIEPPYSDDNIYITNYYAIENYIATPHVLKELLINYFRIHYKYPNKKDTTNADDKIAQFITEYKIFQKTFSNEILILMAVILTMRQKRLALKEKYGGEEYIPAGEKSYYKLQQRDLKLDNLFGVRGLFIFKKPYVRNDLLSNYYKSRNSSTFREHCKKGKFYDFCINDLKLSIPAGEVIWKDVLRNVRVLQAIPDEKTYIKGKFELWMFANFLTYVNREVKDKGNKPFDEEDLAFHCGQFVEHSEDLYVFLMINHISNY